MRNNFSKLALAATFGLALAFTFSCSGGDDGSCSINGRTVKIGNQTWMAKNLNCNVSGSKCYDDSEANCNKYGRLYDWKTAKTICPSGWRLPSDADWDKLISYVESNSGCSSCAGKYLKATSGWDYDVHYGNGEDTYEFSALPGGSRTLSGFFRVGDGGYWWSASEDEILSDYANYRAMFSDDEHVYGTSDNKSKMFSVRCVQD